MHTHTCIHTTIHKYSLSLSLVHTFSRSLSFSLLHSHTYTQTPSLSLSQAGAGTIRFRALVKQGIANNGTLYFPNLSVQSANKAFAPKVLQPISDPVDYAA